MLEMLRAYFVSIFVGRLYNFLLYVLPFEQGKRACTRQTCINMNLSPVVVYLLFDYFVFTWMG